jgi:hypothetical protein
MVDDLRPDIEKARSLMSAKLGSGREIRRLAEYLWDDEQVERMLSGTYGGGTGLLVLTNRRLLFVKDGMMKKTLEDFPLDKISSIQWSSGIALGKVIIFASGNKAEVGSVTKKDGKDLADLVRERIAGISRAAAPTPPAPPPVGTASVADELRKLADLRDTGVLTDDEFAAQKARLLGT